MACACGIGSEHSSLLVLSLPEQFADHGLECPADHSAFGRWTELVAQRQKDKAEREASRNQQVSKKLSSLVAPMAQRYQAMVGGKPAKWGQPVASARTSANHGSDLLAGSSLMSATRSAGSNANGAMAPRLSARYSTAMRSAGGSARSRSGGQRLGASRGGSGLRSYGCGEDGSLACSLGAMEEQMAYRGMAPG